MGKTREIKKRIKAVGNIRRITKTMQMIATSKFARAQQKATATKPFTEGVFDLVRQIADNLSSGGSGISHPLISGPAEMPKTAPKPVTLIITSDRGLCGPYNGSVLRTAMAHLRNAPGASPKDGGEVEIAGRKGASFLKFNGVPTSQQHALGDKPDYRDIERIAQVYMDRFIKGEIASVHVVYMKFLSVGRQKPEVMQLLPLQPPAKVAAAGDKKVGVEYEFSPPAELLLNTLLPAAVKSMLSQAINDAVVSEHIARMVAMKSATDNAGKMGKRLTRQYNRARQAQITTELTEIISGAAALE
ncbi:MAG: ATP synthase F1 subunit gamma [Phycisphaerales bacterium]|nr:ATP synthase F1 subunit gamma [Phycisphaerales bacterium]